MKATRTESRAALVRQEIIEALRAAGGRQMRMRAIYEQIKDVPALVETEWMKTSLRQTIKNELVDMKRSGEIEEVVDGPDGYRLPQRR